MDQAGILRNFIQRVKAMSELDVDRGEDNFGSDFMVGQNYQEHKPGPLCLKCISSISHHLPFPVSWFSCIPQEVRQGRPHCSLPFPPISSLYMAALHCLPNLRNNHSCPLRNGKDSSRPPFFLLPINN